MRCSSGSWVIHRPSILVFLESCEKLRKGGSKAAAASSASSKKPTPKAKPKAEESFDMKMRKEMWEMAEMEAGMRVFCNLTKQFTVS